MMNHTLTTCVLLAVALTGCTRGMRGGPGSTDKNPGDAQDGFTLSVLRPAGDLKQGTTQGLRIVIQRDESFDHNVVLKFSDMPMGVTLRPVVPVIKHDDDEVLLTLRAADNAAVGTFSIQVHGRPTQGVDSLNEIRFTVVKRDEPRLATVPASDNAKPSRR